MAEQLIEVSGPVTLEYGLICNTGERSGATTDNYEEAAAWATHWNKHDPAMSPHKVVAVITNA